jgi:hypothetical protein
MTRFARVVMPVVMGPLPDLRAALPAGGHQFPAATSPAGTPENVLAAGDRSAAM